MKNGWVERAWRLLVISLCWYFYVHVSSLMSRVFKALFKLAAPSGKEAYSSQPELQKRQKICDSRVANHRCTQEPYCSALIQFFFFMPLSEAAANCELRLNNKSRVLVFSGSWLQPGEHFSNQATNLWASFDARLSNCGRFIKKNLFV